MRTTYANFQDIENHFDREEQQDSLRFQKKPDQSSQETVKFDTQSPQQVERTFNNNKLTRISFGCQQSWQKSTMAQRLQFSNQNSVQSSLQLEGGIHDTAQFPTKFQRPLIHARSSIEELSAEHNDSTMNQSKSKRAKQMSTATYEDEEPQQTTIDNDQMEDYMVKLIEEMKRQQQEMLSLKQGIEKQKSANKKQMQMNLDFCDVLDQTQHQMMVLAKENQLLKKKCNQLNTEPKISTFLTTESDYGSKNPYNQRKLIN